MTSRSSFDILKTDNDRKVQLEDLLLGFSNENAFVITDFWYKWSSEFQTHQ